jgi:hypothetical protein
MILDKDGKIVRHLASGVLGRNARAPFKQGTLDEELFGDGKDDGGKPVPAGCAVRIGLGLQPELAGLLGFLPSNVIGVMGIAVGGQGQPPAVTPDGRFVFVSETARKKPRMMFFVNVSDGATPPGSKVSLGGTDDGPMQPGRTRASDGGDQTPSFRNSAM